jgi:hypothetical protein
VFKDGAVPECRLPFLDRGVIKGRHVARVLGQKGAAAIQLLARSARMCMFTAWCAACFCPQSAIRTSLVHLSVPLSNSACPFAQEFNTRGRVRSGTAKGQIEGGPHRLRN